MDIAKVLPIFTSATLSFLPIRRTQPRAYLARGPVCRIVAGLGAVRARHILAQGAGSPAESAAAWHIGGK